MIDPIELESLAFSPFAKQKADLVILGTPDSSGVSVYERKRDIAQEHEAVGYRLVPCRVLEEALETIKTLSANYSKLMQETAPLILEAAERNDGNPWNRAIEALKQASLPE